MTTAVRHRSVRALATSAWKDDDRKWFAANPKRSHRLRAMFPGEQDSFPSSPKDSPLPAGYVLEILVRQIAPGVRIRWPFGRNVAVPVPDSEPIIHALFDLVSAKDRVMGRIFGAKEVAKLALKYAESQSTN